MSDTPKTDSFLMGKKSPYNCDVSELFEHAQQMEREINHLKRMRTSELLNSEIEKQFTVCKGMSPSFMIDLLMRAHKSHPTVYSDDRYIKGMLKDAAQVIANLIDNNHTK